MVRRSLVNPANTHPLAPSPALFLPPPFPAPSARPFSASRKMNRAAAAAAAGTGDGPAWQEAALDPQTRADPWELEGACCVLRDIFHQLFPALKSTNPLLAGVIGLQQLDQIMPAVGEDFVDPSKPASFAFLPPNAAGQPPRPALKDAAIEDAARRFRDANRAVLTAMCEPESKKVFITKLQSIFPAMDLAASSGAEVPGQARAPRSLSKEDISLIDQGTLLDENFAAAVLRDPRFSSHYNDIHEAYLSYVAKSTPPSTDLAQWVSSLGGSDDWFALSCCLLGKQSRPIDRVHGDKVPELVALLHTKHAALSAFVNSTVSSTDPELRSLWLQAFLTPGPAPPPTSQTTNRASLVPNVVLPSLFSLRMGDLLGLDAAARPCLFTGDSPADICRASQFFLQGLAFSHSRIATAPVQKSFEAFLQLTIDTARSASFQPRTISVHLLADIAGPAMDALVHVIAETRQAQTRTVAQAVLPPVDFIPDLRTLIPPEAKLILSANLDKYGLDDSCLRDIPPQPRAWKTLASHVQRTFTAFQSFYPATNTAKDLFWFAHRKSGNTIEGTWNPVSLDMPHGQHLFQLPRLSVLVRQTDPTPVPTTVEVDPGVSFYFQPRHEVFERAGALWHVPVPLSKAFDYIRAEHAPASMLGILPAPSTTAAAAVRTLPADLQNYWKPQDELQPPPSNPPTPAPAPATALAPSPAPAAKRQRRSNSVTPASSPPRVTTRAPTPAPEDVVDLAA